VHAGGPERLAEAMLSVLVRLGAKTGALPEGAGACESPEAAAARGPAAAWLQVLQYARLMLRALPARRGGVRAWGRGGDDGDLTVENLRELLLMPGVVHTSAAVR
jgi:hypothetical protein